MARLRWIRLKGPRFADGAADIEFGAVTALWGLNDAGKSTLLTAVHDTLALRTGDAALWRPDALSDFDHVAIELSVGEAGSAAYTAAQALLEGPASIEVLGTECEISLEASEPLRQAVIAAEPPPDSDELVQPIPEGQWLRRWLDLCLAAQVLPDEQSRAVADALEAQHTLVLSDDGTLGGHRMRPLWAVRRETAGELGLDVEPGRSPWVSVVGASPRAVGARLLPPPVRAPIEWSALIGAFESDADKAVEVLFAEAENWRAETHEHSREEVRRRWGALLCAVANIRMVPGVRERYTLENGPALHVRSKRRTFEPEALAQGYHLWVQLALMDALEVGQRVTDAWSRMYPDLESEHLVHAVEDLIDGVFAGEFDAQAAAALALEISRGWSVNRGDASPLPYFDSFMEVINRGRLYLLDEPEAHLHPAFQRDAARWIRSTTDDDDMQVLLVTHAPAFLGISGDTRLSHVERREDDTIEVRDLDPRLMSATDKALRELGLDRGELLGLHRAVLFVEGETDQAVLEQLCADRVRDIGLLIQPFHGLKKHERIIEAETLLRVLGPPFHVLVDDLDREQRAEIEDATRAQLDAWLSSNWGNHSQRFAASLMRSARREQRRLHLHGIPYVDILGALDDDIVAGLAAGGKRKYPGFKTLLERHPMKYSDELPRYGVHKTREFFGEAARRMRAAGRSNPDLDGVLDAIWRSVEGWSELDARDP